SYPLLRSLVCPISLLQRPPRTTIHTLSLHDALPISRQLAGQGANVVVAARRVERLEALVDEITRADGKCFAVAVDVTSRDDVHRDRKSTRLNSSHLGISYAVFCLKKKNILNYVRTVI